MIFLAHSEKKVIQSKSESDVLNLEEREFGCCVMNVKL